MLDFIRELFSREQATPYSAEELRVAFKERYHQFRQLLSANNQALDIMSEIEEALEGTQPFGMTFVRERCTRVTTNVYRIVKHLTSLAPNKYESLFEKFFEIQEKIKPYIDSAKIQTGARLVLSLAEVYKEHADQVGAKMANLGEIKNRIGLRVPNGFAITTEGYQRFIEHNELQSEIERRMQTAHMEEFDELFALSEALQRLILEAEIPADLLTAILEQYRILEQSEGAGFTLVMRSSALGEDLYRTSFAGQYRSALNVSRENIVNTYKEIVASKYGMPAMTYRLNRGIRDEDVAMCVGCMSLVDAVAGGVLYSRDPVNIRNRTVVLNSAWGLPKLVVDGAAQTDYYVLSREEPIRIITKEIPPKEEKFVCYPGKGVCQVETVGDEARSASISDEDAVRLAELAIQLEEYYQSPQDIEWCIDTEGAIIILQCRPLKQLDVSRQDAAAPPPQAERGPVIIQGGVTAAPGVAAGPVFVVETDADILKFPRGAVLVASQSLPRWATVLNRAAAVVAERGGVGGHLANVAREFRVPALFAVEGATKLLAPGKVVTVDADGLAVYEGQIESLLKKKAAKQLMEGSPVYEALKGAGQHIVPLYLLDPDALSFRPDNCRTLHDITRFCHEKSISEMFNFGKEHNFPERSAKQLMVEVPMKWLVLNLDDGFKEDVEGKYVTLDNIASEPMVALWEGITAVPWAGPPPVDGKGFMSVMFQATQDTSLVTGVRSKYADLHYFMVSKNYCCLNSRLGFHFSTVETLVSDRNDENYISFQFKGGAADYERRRKRVLFVKEILEGHYFRVDAKEDGLIARLEDFDKDFMIRSLKIVGYIAIHTRQLDMIMSNSTLVNYYRTKICKDIQKLFAHEKVLYLYLGGSEEKEI